jgi:hypothetical protein
MISFLNQIPFMHMHKYHTYNTQTRENLKLNLLKNTDTVFI